MPTRIQKIYTLSFSLLFLAFLCVPLVGFAQEEGTYQLLEPIRGYIEGEVDIATFLQNAFRLGVALATALAVIKIVIGGVKYMTSESITGKDTGKGTIKDALLGLIVIFVAFLVLRVINPDLVEFDLLNTTLGRVTEQVEEQGGGTTTPPSQQTWPSDAIERAELIAGGVSINRSNCTYVGQTACTSVSRLPGRDILIGLRGELGREITITGGTEYWLHSTHGPGARVVDLRADGWLNEFITGSQNVDGISCGEPFVQRGITFEWEFKGCRGSTGPHWHVKY